MTRALLAVALAAALQLDLHAADTQAMLSRVSEEADAFRRLAPSLLGTEMLEQKARKPTPRFRPRTGSNAKTPAPVLWQDRQIVSEYGFVSLAGEQDTLHELRHVLTVDTKPVADKKSEDSLARIISLNDDQRERELLKEFEKYGLVGAVTDFGPLLMLFTPRQVEHFEFSLQGSQTLGATPALIYRYTQIDGTEALTVFQSNAKGDKARPSRYRVQGELWVRADNYVPLRVTVRITQGEGRSAIVEEASVEYAQSQFGVLVPSAINHKELIGGQLNVQNSFLYKDFHKFGADAQIQFSTPSSNPK